MSLLRTKGKMTIEGDPGFWTADNDERSFERGPSFVQNWVYYGSWNWKGRNDMVVESSLLVNRTTGMVDHFECKVRIPHQCDV